MELFAGLSVAVLIVVASFVAIRTFALWRRTRGLPELLLSLMMFSATVLGYPLAIATTQVSTDLWQIPAASQIVFTFGYACLLLFTMKVFRPRAHWAAWLAGATFCLLLVSTVAQIVEAVGESPRPPQERIGLSLLNSMPIAVAYFWTTSEALAFHRRLRLRLRLGLADAVVTNRMLLWGLMGLAAGTAVVLNAGAMLAGSFMSPPIVLASSVLGLAHAVCLLGAFHPPAWYRAWIERRAAPLAA